MSPLIKARGILLSHDRYDVNGHLHRNRRSCRVSHGDYHAVTWEPRTFSDEVLGELRNAVARSDLLVLNHGFPADEQTEPAAGSCRRRAGHDEAQLPEAPVKPGTR